MKHILLLASLVALAPLLYAQSPAREAKTDDSPEKEVRQLELKRVKALVRSDTATLDSILSDDLIYTHSTGLVDTKASFIDSIKSGALKYEAMDHDDPSVRMFADLALITGRSAVRVRTANAELQSFQIRFTNVYAKRGGRWQMVAWQSTRLP